MAAMRINLPLVTGLATLMVTAGGCAGPERAIWRTPRPAAAAEPQRALPGPVARMSARSGPARLVAGALRIGRRAC